MGRWTAFIRMFLVIGAGALLVTSITIAAAPRLWRIVNAHTEEPIEIPEFQPLAQRTYVFDADGNEIAVYELENSQPITLAAVPDHVIDAFLAVEDNEFWVHDGVNVRSLIRATLSNFASDAPQQGASTITMQVVKNDFLAGLERDGRYKLLQIVYAMRLEKEKTKEEILERYLNTVFFGNNAYGVAAAAEIYFGKSVADLTFIEAAFLAGLVRSPSGFDPINNPERSRNRFIQVVDRLVDDELISPLRADRILDGPDAFVIPERVRSIPTRATERTHFTELVREYLLQRSDILGDTYEERYNQLFRGGLRIHTTLDPYLQARAEEARLDLPPTPQNFDAALTSVETRTGAVRAMVGGKPFEPGTNEFNLALAPSQTGSSIKLFILSAAVQAGAEPNDVINGTRGCRLPTGDSVEPIFQITGGVSGGVFNLRQHTYRSINCAFARLSQIVGLNRVVDTTYRMAESPFLYRGQPESERIPLQPFASFATGANEMSTLDMAAGMQSIANLGVHHEPYFIEYVEQADGTRLYTHESQGTRVLDEDVSLTVISMMKDVLTAGTARRELSDFAQLRPAAGKTGTQQDNTTAWFVGGTPYLSTAVMVRDPARYTPMANIPEFEFPRIQGGTYPARIWGTYMEPAHVFEPVTDWSPPPPASRSAVRLFLPGVECQYTIVGYETTTTAAPEEPAPAPPPAPGAGEGGEVGEVAEGGPAAIVDQIAEQSPAQEDPPPAEPPPAAPPPAPPTTIATTTTEYVPVPIYAPVETGTTIAPDNLDPYAPLPSAPLSDEFLPCPGF